VSGATRDAASLCRVLEKTDQNLGGGQVEYSGVWSPVLHFLDPPASGNYGMGVSLVPGYREN
jgi:hypothetical protein